MIIKRLIISSLIAFGIVIVGCGPTMLDQNWGRSVETARYNQTLNPDAGQNLEPVEGLDGPGAENALKAYHQSFKNQEAPSGYNINLTGIGKKK